jgi:predicted metalloprotease
VVWNPASKVPRWYRIIAPAAVLGLICTGCSASDSPTATPQVAALPSFDQADEFSVLVTEMAGSADAQGRIDAFWSDVFATLDPAVAYESPSRIVRYVEGEIPDTACAGEGNVEYWRNRQANWCPADSSIAVDEVWMRDLVATTGPIAAPAIIGHEWGHQLQSLLGLPEFDLQRELQADCFAGMFIKHAELDLGLFAGEDVNAAIEAFFRIGNERYAEGDWYVADQHGSPQQRMLAFGSGWVPLDGWPYCIGYGDFIAADFATVGNYRLVNLPGFDGLAADDANSYVFNTPHGTVALAWTDQVPLPAGSIVDELHAVMAAGYGDSIVSLFPPVVLDTSTLLGTGAYQYYELKLPDASGNPQSMHGLFGLLVSETVEEGIVVLVQKAGPAATDPPDEAELTELAQISSLMFLVIGRLCGPDNSPIPNQPGFATPCLSEH